MSEQPKRGSDEPIKIPLDPEEALPALLKVDPASEPAEDDVPQEQDEAEPPADGNNRD